jgi:hypothetical protein
MAGKLRFHPFPFLIRLANVALVNQSATFGGEEHVVNQCATADGARAAWLERSLSVGYCWI